MLNTKIMTLSGQGYRDLSTWPEFTTVVSFSYYSDWGVTGIDVWSYEPRVITLPTGVALKFANYMCGGSDWPILCDISGETALVPRVIAPGNFCKLIPTASPLIMLPEYFRT